jgi:hypothetical protein
VRGSPVPEPSTQSSSSSHDFSTAAVGRTGREAEVGRGFMCITRGVMRSSPDPTSVGKVVQSSSSQQPEPSPDKMSSSPSTAGSFDGYRAVVVRVRGVGSWVGRYRRMYNKVVGLVCVSPC